MRIPKLGDFRGRTNKSEKFLKWNALYVPKFSFMESQIDIT